MTDFVVWLLLGWAFVQSWLLQRALKREGALQKRINILQGAVDGVNTGVALAMEKLGITKDEILKRATEQRLGRPLTPEEAEGPPIPRAIPTMFLKCTFGCCGGLQPLAGEQVAGLLLRDPDLNPCFSHDHVFAKCLRTGRPPSCRCREMGFVLIRPGPPAD